MPTICYAQGDGPPTSFFSCEGDGTPAPDLKPYTSYVYLTKKGTQTVRAQFEFIVPSGNNGVHIVWSTRERSGHQEQYEFGGRYCEYLIYIHGYPVPAPQDWKVQYCEIRHDLLPDDCGRWFTGYIVHRDPPAPAPAPAPMPRPVAVAPNAPTNVIARRIGDMDIAISWTLDPLGEGYVIERRLGVAPLFEGSPTTPWVEVGRAERGASQGTVRVPVLPPGTSLKNIFRVTAFNGGGQASSVPVAELASNR